MPYYLHVYGVPESASEHAPPDAARMANFIQAAGQKVGELEFGAGESDLMVGAIEELMDVDFFELMCGELFEVGSDETAPDFGSLNPEEARGMLDTLTKYLARPNLESDPTFAQVADDNAFEPERLLALMRRLRDLLESALQRGIPTGIYG